MAHPPTTPADAARSHAAEPVTSEPSAKPATHDTAPPPALLDYMVREWKPASTRMPPKLRNAAAFAARRRALSQLFPGETLVIPTGHEKVRANDTYYRFRPGTDFYYLTGNLEPDCVLMMLPESGGGHRDVLFVEPNPGKSDSTFFTDRIKGELWVGPRLGVPRSQARFDVHQARALSELPGALGGLRGAATRPVRVLRGMSPAVDGVLEETPRDKELAAALSEMRLLKDAQEIRELSAAIASTRRGFDDVIAGLRTARHEREVEGIFNLRARVEGNDIGYNTIAAAGEHACILHWVKNEGDIRPGTLLLLDAGVEAHTLYTADITRTLPVSGRFSREQREIYELVHAAQAAGFAEVKPGKDFLDPNRAAMKVLAAGLERLGILDDAAEALADQNQFYKRYSLHNVSHMLGLDVHDCAQARAETYKFGKLTPGMVLTVEPGLYIAPEATDVAAEYRGIGIRIEDDILVTPDGHENLTISIPKEVSDLESLTANG
jgi:Xaa-Pro aminopeptidase